MPWTDPRLESFKTSFVSTSTKAVTNTAAENSLIPAGAGTRAIPAGWLKPGRAVRLSLSGTIMTPTILSGNATFRFKLNGTTVASGSALALIGGLGAGANFEWIQRLQCLTEGAAGKVNITGKAVHPSGLIGARSDVGMNAKEIALDTTIEQVIDCTVQWGVANPVSSIEVMVAIIESLEQT